MANPNDKLQSLLKYAEGLRHTLNSPVPAKHAHRAEAFKQMIQIDLKKTESRIAKLKG